MSGQLPEQGIGILADEFCMSLGRRGCLGLGTKSSPLVELKNIPRALLLAAITVIWFTVVFLCIVDVSPEQRGAGSASGKDAALGQDRGYISCSVKLRQKQDGARGTR